MESINKIQQYIPAFEKRLDGIIIGRLNTEPYYKKYLGYLLLHKKYYLEIYASVLNDLLKNSIQDKETIILIDYGAGNGLLGLFAKFCGFYKVYINDLNKPFTDIAHQLAEILDISIDAFITGDIEAVTDFFQSKKTTAIVGTDVVEHIYDLNFFFYELKKINPSIVSVFTTASNPFNKYKVKQLEKLQVKDEYKGGSPNDYIFFGETTIAPFIKIREKIIREKFPLLTDEEVTRLTKLTRGLIKKDILSTVQKYSNDRVFPVPPIHPTNTCDPITGSWTERILTETEYKEIYKNADFELKIHPGFYNEYGGTSRSFLFKILNKCIKILGISIAPFITLIGIPGK